MRSAISHALVSIIVPAYNVESWISKCLESLLTQSYRNLEVIVIDDGSTDETAKKVSRVAESDKRVRFISRENRGLSRTRNEGIDLSTGEIVLFVDSDDWLHPSAVEQIAKKFGTHNCEIVIFQSAKIFSETKKWELGTDSFYWKRLSKVAPNHIQEFPETLGLYPLAQLKAMRRSFLTINSLKFMAGVNYEDNLFSAEVFSLNPRAGFIPEPLYAWRQQRLGQITSTPHPSHCCLVIGHLVSIYAQLPTSSRAYAVVAISRLASKVASQMPEKPATELLQTCSTLLQNSWSRQELNEVQSELFRNAFAFHPVDILLSAGVISFPEGLAKLLSTSQRDHSKLLFISRKLIQRHGTLAFGKFAIHSLINFRLVARYMKGFGHGNVSPF